MEKLLLTSIKYIGIKESLTGWNDQIKIWITASCKSIGLNVPEDDSQFAWCACWISNMLIESGLWDANHIHIVAARKFLDVGERIELKDIQLGDIVILERGAGKGHIGEYINQTENKIKLLSGNSMDSVSISDYDKKRILGVIRIVRI